MEICDAVISVHMPVLFEVTLDCNTVKSGAAAARRCRIINPSTAVQFSAAFNQNCIFPESVCNTEELISWFQSTCQTVLGTAAPLKIRQPKTKSESWLSDTTHTVRRECCRAEHKWKKDKLQVSFQMLRDCWSHYQRTVKDAKRKYFSDIILSNCHKPRVLFKTINFMHFFIDKVSY